VFKSYRLSASDPFSFTCRSLHQSYLSWEVFPHSHDDDNEDGYEPHEAGVVHGVDDDNDASLPIPGYRR
jgi:hypothetical protein